jgi:hypothetical protein
VPPGRVLAGDGAGKSRGRRGSTILKLSTLGQKPATEPADACRCPSKTHSLDGLMRLPNRSSRDYRHIVQNGRLVAKGGLRQTLRPPRPCVAGVACVAQELSRPRPQHSSVYPRVEPSQIEGQPSQGRREAALGQAVVRVDSWQNFTDIRCESSNPSSTDGGSFS